MMGSKENYSNVMGNRTCIEQHCFQIVNMHVFQFVYIKFTPYFYILHPCFIVGESCSRILLTTRQSVPLNWGGLPL